MSDNYQGPERRAHATLSDADMEAIAERAAAKALEKVYAQVGKSIVTRVFWVVGLAAVGLVMFLSGKGVIKLP